MPTHGQNSSRSIDAHDLRYSARSALAQALAQRMFSMVVDCSQPHRYHVVTSVRLQPS